MASIAKFKATLRQQTRRRAVPHEVNFLNITAMMDMMTIILVFLLKSLSASSANMPQTNDLSLPLSILQGEAAQEGIQVVVSRDKILVNGVELKTVAVPSCFNSASDAPDPRGDYKLVSCPGDSKFGFAPQYKGRGTSTDLLIQDLFNMMDNPVKVQDALASKKPKDAAGNPAPVEAIIFFDRYTSYRVMAEVMYTLGQAKVSKFHFLAQQAK